MVIILSELCGNVNKKLDSAPKKCYNPLSLIFSEGIITKGGLGGNASCLTGVSPEGCVIPPPKSLDETQFIQDAFNRSDDGYVQH